MKKIKKFKKYYGLIISIVLLSTILTGCNNTCDTNPSIQTHNMIGINALVEIPMGEGLYFDYTTGIVYWWNGASTWSNCATTPTPYYSPNGLLYRYIPETGELEEVMLSSETSDKKGEK